MRARSSTALIAVAVLLAAPASGSARVEDAVVVAPGGGAELAADEGHVLLVLDILDQLDHLRFTPYNSRFAAFTIEDVTPGFSTFLLRLPAGSYCLANFRSGKLRWSRKDKSKPGLCFAVVAGALNYPGNFYVRAANGQGLSGWSFQVGQFLARMARDYPQVLAEHTRLRVTGTSDGEGPRYGTREIAGAAFQAGDSELGARLLVGAAEEGDSNAMLELGVRFLDGEGLRQNTTKALAWLARAAQAGDARAARIGCDIEGTLDPPDADAARTLCTSVPAE